MSWLASMLQCFACTCKWAGVYPVEADEDALECPSCGAMDSEVLKRWGPDESGAVMEAAGDDPIVEYRE